MHGKPMCDFQKNCSKLEVGRTRITRIIANEDPMGAPQLKAIHWSRTRSLADRL
jgi:hypothetical protein